MSNPQRPKKSHAISGEAIYRIYETEPYMDHLEAERDNWKYWKMKASQAAERLEAENRRLREQIVLYQKALDYASNDLDTEDRIVIWKMLKGNTDE